MRELLLNRPQFAVVDFHCITQREHVVCIQSPAKIQNVTELCGRHFCLAGDCCLAETALMYDVFENDTNICHGFTSDHSNIEYTVIITLNILDVNTKILKILEKCIAIRNAVVYNAEYKEEIK